MSAAPLNEINIASIISYRGGVHPRFARGIFPVLRKIWAFSRCTAGSFPKTTPFIEIKK
jgi:hypothetical protein